MPHIKKISAVFVAMFAAAALYLAARSYVSLPGLARAADADLSDIKLPDGYALNYFAPPDAGLHSPRQLAEGEDGWIFAGSRGDKVYALRDEDGDGIAEDIRVVAAGMRVPHGVAFANGDLYVGAVDGVYVVRNVAAKLAGEDVRPRLFIGGLADSEWHGTRHLKIGADGMLYVSLGTPCNACIPPDPELTGVIRRYPLPDGGAGETFARGVRNSVGFDFHPADGALWFTDNGRDWLGDDLPHDELNRAPRAGMHFGFPYCHQGDFPDPEFGADGEPCENYEAPVLLTGAHVANLGMAFDAAGEYAYIALHGSWNRSRKTGYAVYRARTRPDGAVSEYAPFAEGWLRKDETVSGRPADVLFTAAGDLLVSDDFAHVIYRARGDF